MTPRFTLWICSTLSGKTRYRVLTNGQLFNGHPTFTSLKAATRYIAKLNAA